MKPSILRQYGLGADVSRRDSIGTFLLRLVKNTTIILTPGYRPPSPTPPLKHYSDQAKVTGVEVKDFKQTVAIESGYAETNAWLE
jgi:hypothetical protein